MGRVGEGLSQGGGESGKGQVGDGQVGEGARQGDSAVSRYLGSFKKY